jgi:hypothetical protein
MSKKNYEYALGFALHLSRLFSVSVNLDSPCTVQGFSFPNACLIIAMISVELLLRFAQNLMHIRRVHREIA